jgi:hypothetical protein
MRWHQRTRPIREHYQRVQSSASAAPAYNFEQSPLKGVTQTNDRYSFGIITEEVVVGSL